MSRDKKWTENELFSIINFYNKVDITILMKALDRSEGSIRRKAIDLGLQKPLQRLTPEQKKYILANRKKLTHQAIADLLSLKRNTVTKFLSTQLKKPR